MKVGIEVLNVRRNIAKVGIVEQKKNATNIIESLEG